MTGIKIAPRIVSGNSINLNVKSENDDKIDFNFNELRFEDKKIECLKKYFFPSLKGDILYIISIIDFFQLYNLQKNLETKYKQLTKRERKNEISSMPSNEYKDRFIEYVKNKTDSEHYIKEINDPENKNDF